MKSLRLLALAPLLLAACGSLADQRDVESPWVEAFQPPRAIDTERMHLEPLRPEVNQLDYDAAQSSVEHLRTTLQWGSWPSPEMTPEQNRGDLERHWKEFENREAYAYTVLDPSGAPCIGCVYLNPDQNQPRGLRMAYWVTADQLEGHLDTHLVTTVLETIERTWPVDVVTIGLPVQNPRGIQILTDLGLETVETSDQRVVFAWKR